MCVPGTRRLCEPSEMRVQRGKSCECVSATKVAASFARRKQSIVFFIALLARASNEAERRLASSSSERERTHQHMTSSTSLAARRPRRGTTSAEAEPAPLPALLPSSAPTPVADGNDGPAAIGDGVASSSPLLDGRVASSTAAAVAPLSVADAGAEAAAVATIVNRRILPVFV